MLLGDAPIAVDSQSRGAAWGANALGVVTLDWTTDVFSFSLLDVHGEPRGAPYTLDALGGSHSVVGLVVVGAPSGFAVVFLEPLDTEVFGSGSTAVEVLRFAVRLLFLDDTGRAVGAPTTVAEALTPDWVAAYQQIPLGAVLSGGEALVVWADVTVTEESGRVNLTMSLRAASATTDGEVTAPVEIPPTPYSGQIGRRPVVARAGRSLAVAWSYFCAYDAPDCVAVSAGCCE